MTTGIYALYWEDDYDKVYIGQSLDIEARVANHTWALKKGVHVNYKLQEKYISSNSAPKYYIVEEGTPNCLNNKEASWVKEFNAIIAGYNIAEVPGHEFSSCNYPNSKYEKLKLLLLFRELRNPKTSFRYLSTKYAINISSIRAISRGAEHSWLHIKYPTISSTISNAKSLRSSYSRTSGKTYEVISPIGSTHTVDNISLFCKQNKLNVGNFAEMLYGNAITSKGWRLSSTKLSNKVYILYHKVLGITEQVYNRQDFCTKYSVDSGSLSRLLSGKYKTIKGWVLKNTLDSDSYLDYNNFNE